MRRFLMLLVMLLMTSTAFAKESAKVEYEDATVETVDLAIKDFLTLNPAHPLMKHPEVRREYAEDILVACKKANLPWWSIATMSFYESSFRAKATGKAGETGLLQLNGDQPWQYCEKIEGRAVNRDSAQDQYLCGAYWLRKGIDSCGGSLKGGVASYLAGEVCTPQKDGDLYKSVQLRVGRMKGIKIKVSQLIDQQKETK